ncbi:ATP-binding cassette domain-containing protein [Sphingobium limneticum]|uniref:ATP-binding cassette domain-containing protein n=1 Tax=Sphingobium limneticum TaxID=1007511 RepID=UPI0014793655|nr:ATP-binding cassette domain-containing protein [Sphingobium limneticum]
MLFLTTVLALFPVVLAIFSILLFDVAMVGRSGETLVGVMALTLVAVAFMTAFAYLRSQALRHLADSLDIRLGEAAIEARSHAGNPDGSLAEDMQITQALDAMRRALSCQGASAALDLAALIPLLIVMIFLSAWLALTLLLGVLIMASLLYRAARRIRAANRMLLPMLSDRHVVTESHRRHSELVRGLGMRPDVVMARRRSTRRFAVLEQQISDVETVNILVQDTMAVIMFILLMIIGAWLAMTDKASPGVVLAAAILGWRSLAPLVRVSEYLKPLVDGHDAFRNLGRLLDAVSVRVDRTALPSPSSTLSVEQLAVAPPGTRTVVLRDAAFRLSAGDVLGIIGMSGSGKSSLLKALANIWPTVAGKIRLDDAALDQWQPDQLARHIGYMPQTLDLFSGTIAQNISRFDPAATAEAVIAAGAAAKIHDMIVRLPQGYETSIGEDGVTLSVAQRQLLALARALYRDPFLVLLDEPATHLDGRGQQALSQAIADAKARGAIIVIVGNASATVDVAEQIMVLRDGAVQDFGPKQDVRQRLLEGRNPPRSQEASRPSADAKE